MCRKQLKAAGYVHKSDSESASDDQEGDDQQEDMGQEEGDSDSSTLGWRIAPLRRYLPITVGSEDQNNVVGHITEVHACIRPTSLHMSAVCCTYCAVAGYIQHLTWHVVKTNWRAQTPQQGLM